MSVEKLTLPFIAVRKNRYVVLPVDFEEAWKVCCLAQFGSPASRLYKLNSLSLFLPPSQQTVKRGDETHEFCTFTTCLELSSVSSNNMSTNRSVINLYYCECCPVLAPHHRWSSDLFLKVIVVRYWSIYYTFLSLATQSFEDNA